MATTPVDVNALIRGNARLVYSAAQDLQPVLGDGAEVLVVQALPPLAELVKLGNSWQALYQTGVAATTAVPTTTSLLSLTNGETGANAKSYLIETFGTYEGVVDATQTDVTMIMAMLNKSGSANPSAGTVVTTANGAIQSLSGKGSYGGNATIRSAATVVNDGWFPHQTIGSMAAAAAGANFKVNEVFCNGLYIVRPGGAFSLYAVKAAAAAALQQFAFVRWHEVQLNLG
jgi:hypothetical protein